MKYLDAVNFPNGNPDADPSIEAVSFYVVEAMSEETADQVQYELSTPIDADKAVILGAPSLLTFASGSTGATGACILAAR